MNKLEKILAQSVTPEMVAEQLTEQEIEEVIEEYELKIEESEENIERAENEEKNFLEVVERCQKLADEWREVVEQEKEKLNSCRSVIGKAKQALTKRAKNNEIKPTPNKQCEKLIEEAREFWRERLNFSADEPSRTVFIVNEVERDVGNILKGSVVKILEVERNAIKLNTVLGGKQ